MRSPASRWSLCLWFALAVIPHAPIAPADAPAAVDTAPMRLEGRFDDGALWRAAVPHAWNGTLLLYSHGFTADVKPPQLAPPGLESWLLAKGYALAASSYSQGGWAVAEAVPDQLALLTVFTARVGRPALTVAWGDSMGGLITLALAESPVTPIAGAVSACGSIAGTLAMMNTALDGAFAFVTLQAPQAGIELVNVQDDRRNSALVTEALQAALRSPQGRARVALAGVLGGLPTWTEGDTAPPPRAYELQLDQMAQAFAAGLFPPRTDQERRAGGVLSWNVGVDYPVELRRSGRWDWVAHFYRAAHLDLDRELERLNATARVQAQRQATQYMRAHYAPSGRLAVPLLSIHTVGDGLTSEVFQGGYARTVSRNGASARYRAASVQAAGHCRFQPSEYIAALETLEQRLRLGTWSAEPENLNARAAATGLGAGRFIPHRPAPLLRPCWGSERRCQGEPAP